MVTSWDIEAATGMCYAIFRDEKKMLQRGGRIAVQTDWLVRFRDVAEDFFVMQMHFSLL